MGGLALWTLGDSTHCSRALLVLRASGHERPLHTGHRSVVIFQGSPLLAQRTREQSGTRHKGKQNKTILCIPVYDFSDKA